jgi:transcriptional antiterminator
MTQAFCRLTAILYRPIREQIRIVLPEHEAISVAMHLINAESESGDMSGQEET